MSDATPVSPTARKFGYPQTLIAETKDWLVLLRPQQVTLGSLVLLCREPVTAFSDVSPRALEGLHPVLKNTERLLQDLVCYQKINYLMLMMVDPDVHFHVFPRYEGKREYRGRALTDAGWPGPPRLDSGVSLPVDAQEMLAADLRARWGGA
ncbi:MAG TPA: HIT family protein [Alphaproteobacteria bacterium]|nr:HIT family protein [Alphaproteobacteria bacterium]